MWSGGCLWPCIRLYRQARYSVKPNLNFLYFFFLLSLSLSLSLLQQQQQEQILLLLLLLLKIFLRIKEMILSPIVLLGRFCLLSWLLYKYVEVEMFPLVPSVISVYTFMFSHGLPFVCHFRYLFISRLCILGSLPLPRKASSISGAGMKATAEALLILVQNPWSSQKRSSPVWSLAHCAQLY